MPIQSRQTLQKSGLQQAQGKTQNGTFGCRSAILGRGLERGLYYLWYLKAVFSWKNSVFSREHKLCRHERVQLEKQKFTKNKGLFAKMQKGVFWSVFCFFFWGVFLQKGPKRLYSCNFKGFIYFVPLKGLPLKSFFSSYSVFSFGFLLPSLSKSIFSLLFVRQPSFLKIFLFWVSFIFSCLFLS